MDTPSPAAITITKAEATHALMTQVVEARLTRTELLDVIVEKVQAELFAQADRLNEQVKALGEPTLSFNQAVTLAGENRADLTVSVDQSYHNGRYQKDTERVLKIKCVIKTADLPKKYLEHVKALEDLNSQKRDVSNKLDRLRYSKSKARMEMLRTALESTPEGRTLMQAIDVMKDSFKEKLLENTAGR